MASQIIAPPEAPKVIAAIPTPPAEERAQGSEPSILERIIVEDDALKFELQRAAADKKLAQTYCPAAGDQGALIVAWGRDFGWNAAQAAMFIDNVKGKPALKAVGRQNLMKKAGYSWREIQHDDTVAKFRFYYQNVPMEKADGKPLDLSFSMEEALKAGYVDGARGNQKQGNYDKIPKNLLFARLASNFHRWYASEVDGSSLPDPSEVEMSDVIAATEQNIASKNASKLDELAAELKAVGVAQ